MRYERFCAPRPPATSMSLADAAKYFGIVIGPDALRSEWQSVVAKFGRRLPNVVASPSLPSRTVSFNIQCSPLVHHKAQFCEPDVAMVRFYRRSQQRLARAPYMSVPAGLLDNLKSFGYHTEVRSLPHVVIQMQVSVLQRSGVWPDAVRRIRRAALPDAAHLDPPRSWHEHPTMSTLQRADDWLRSLAPQLRVRALRGDARKVAE